MHYARELGINDVTQEQIDMVIRAIRDPMIGGWPLIHWEWVFSERWGVSQVESRGANVVGEWPESVNRVVTISFDPDAGVPDFSLPDQ